MQFWIFAAIIAAAATAVLASGFLRRAPRAGADARTAAMAIYKDQLAELDRDLERGLVAPADAEGQRAEIGRRLLALAREGDTATTGRAPAVAVLLTLLVPLVAVLVYKRLGVPGVPDLPRAERLANAEKNGDLPALVARVEAHLAKRPDDATGWQLLVPVYQNMGRLDDAAEAISRIIAIKGPTAALQAELAETLTVQNQGMMTDAALAAADAALKLDPKDPKARYYAALGKVQNGKPTEALAEFQALLADTPADAPWRDLVLKEIEKIKQPAQSSSAPQIDGGQMAGAANMTPEQRTAMIRSMVDGLDQKLAADGTDLQGWLRLIRARTVLNEKDKALDALQRARAALKADTTALTSLDTLAKDLQLQ